MSSDTCMVPSFMSLLKGLILGRLYCVLLVMYQQILRFAMDRNYLFEGMF